jgi:hypothetical protein
LTIAAFRPEGSRHQPRTRVQLLYDDRMLYGRFRVEDRYVRCRRTGFQAEVYKDSCVEFFVEPVLGRGYFNFEFNCGGALRAFFITDPTRVPGGFKAFTPLSAADGERVRRVASLPAVVDPEIAAPTLWDLEFGIPLAVLAAYAGPAASPAGATWRANFYKCGDETTHPHWGAWSPVDRLDFHRPPCFGELRFDADGGHHGCPGDRPRMDFPGEGPPDAGGSKEAP